MFTHGPVRGVCMMSVLAGLLAFPLPVRLPDSSVAFVNRRSKEGITAAGTAPVFHRIPLHRNARLPNSVAKIRKISEK